MVFHKGILHLGLNMMALVPIASPLERLMGSARTAHAVLLFALTNSLITAALAYGARLLSGSQYLIQECGIGFSGVIFSFIVLENSLSPGPARRCVLRKAASGSRCALQIILAKATWETRAPAPPCPSHAYAIDRVWGCTIQCRGMEELESEIQHGALRRHTAQHMP